MGIVKMLSLYKSYVKYELYNNKNNYYILIIKVK